MHLNPNDRSRYYNQIVQSGQCLLWAGTIGEDGYGRMSLNKKTTLVHKIAFYLQNGREPSSYLIHTCDNNNCVNPDHIIEGKNEGRPVKVSAQKILELKKEGLTASQIAQKLNCSVSLVRKRLS